MFLLQSPDVEVQRAASAALGNLAVDCEYQEFCENVFNMRVLLVVHNRLLVYIHTTFFFSKLRTSSSSCRWEGWSP